MAAVQFDTIRSIAAGSLSGSYATVGSALAHNWRIVKFTNNTDGDLLLSTDGTTNMIFVPAGSFTLYDLSTNAPPVMVSDCLELALGTQFYAKTSTAATTGSLWIEGIYARGQ